MRDTGFSRISNEGISMRLNTDILYRHIFKKILPIQRQTLYNQSINQSDQTSEPQKACPKDRDEHFKYCCLSTVMRISTNVFSRAIK